MNTITITDYDPYKYFLDMARKHKGNWYALFLMPNKRTRNASMRKLFNLLEGEHIPTTLENTSGKLITIEGSKARFIVAFKGITEHLAGNEYQQIDGTEYLTKYDEDKVRTLLRTKISLALAKDMAIR